MPSLALKIQRKVIFSPKCVFSETDHHTSLIDTTWLDRMRDNDEAISSEVTSIDSATIQCLGDSDAENEDFSEVDEKKTYCWYGHYVR